MQNNVIYGAFGQTRTATATPDSVSSLTRLDENTPATLNNRIHASLKVLSDLGALINEPGLPKEIGDPLRVELEKLQSTANAIATKLIRAHTDDRVFLEVQPELTAFGQQLVAFEADVLHKTGAELELVEPPPPPALAQVRAAIGSPKGWVNSPKFWIGASIGVTALGGLLWWAFQKDKPAEKETFTRKVERVKLRRAMPAR